MTERSIEHGSFTLERHYDVPPGRVYAAWADPTAKARWFSGPVDWQSAPHELDLRVGGHEVSGGGPADGPVHTFRATYWDLGPNERIVYASEMLFDETFVSVALVTVS
jgi:uncharacterized protein YndB with AHSA1/START domain